MCHINQMHRDSLQEMLFCVKDLENFSKKEAFSLDFEGWLDCWQFNMRRMSGKEMLTFQNIREKNIPVY